MFTRAFGEIITNVMTVNPVLADIASASAILDTSNYTFQAMTFGKDGDGFQYHSHTVSTTEYINGVEVSGVSGYNGGVLNVVNYGYNDPSGASSYIFSATELEFSSTYSSIPSYPSPYDTRLERGDTSNAGTIAWPHASAIPNLGHYANPALDANLSAAWNVIGGYPPLGSVAEYHFYSGTDLTMTGTLSSFLNEEGLIDKDGYIRFADANFEVSPSHASGARVSEGTSMQVSGGGVKASMIIQGGDAASIAAFGGIKHVGLYCLDMQAMLDAGLRPPFTWNNLNNNWSYKLVIKSTMMDNALWHQDGDILAYPNQSGFKHILTDNSLLGVGTAVYASGGPKISVVIDFK